MAPVDPNMMNFTAYVYETKAVKTRPSMKTLGHENSTFIHKHGPCRPKVDEFYSIRAWNMGGENKT